jgi:hypothetical protein
MYDDKPDGLSGNEDCGQMSAWYILSAMGFYPVCPGSGEYILGAPLFGKVIIHLENGKQFTIRAGNASPENKYIQSVTFNGKPWSKSWFSHDHIVSGGEFVFEMGSNPAKSWGADAADRPQSEKFFTTAVLPYAETRDHYFLESGTVTLKCDDPQASIHYTTDGSRPTEESPEFVSPVKVGQTTVIRFASFKPGVEPSVPVSVTVTRLQYEKWTDYRDKGPFTPGLAYKYYEAQVMDQNELDALTPVDTGILSFITIDQRRREDYFGYEYSGFLEIPRDGIYTFAVKVNDKCTLYLDDREFMRGGIRTVALKKGMYRLKEKYFQLGAKKFNQVSWEGPGIAWQEIPASAYYHKK